MKTRSRSLTLLPFLGLLLVVPGLASAGPNAGGTLILHANPNLAYTLDIQNYCGMSALDSCSAAVTSVPWELGKRIVFHALAAFPPGSSPRLKGLAFGIDYDSTKFILAAHQTCADFEIPGTRWPAPGTGTTQSWTTASQAGLIGETYWFVGYAYSAQDGEDSTSVDLIPHPVQQGVFVDDAVPAAIDTIAGYGKMGFGMQGALPCPQLAEDDSWVPDSPDVDVSIPDSPEPGPCTNYGNHLRWVGAAPADWYPQGIASSNGWVFAAGRDVWGMGGALKIFQPAPNQSAEGGTVSFSTFPTDVAVSGDFAYVVRENGLYVVDATDHLSPTLADSLIEPSSDFLSVAVSGQFLYATTWAGDLWVAYLPTPGDILPIDFMQGLTRPVDIVVSGTLAYVADGYSGLRVVRVPPGGAAEVLGTADTPSFAQAVAVEGHLACVADWESGLQVIDVTDPMSPQILGSVPTTNPCSEVIISNGMAYATDRYALYAIDLADPENPTVVGTSRVDGLLTSLAISGDRIYLADSESQSVNLGRGAIHIVDLASDFWLGALGNVGTSGWAYGVAVAGTYAYVADYEAGLQVINCSNPANPAVVATLDTPGQAMDVAICGVHAFVADGESGLQVVDITDPESPQIVGSIDTQGTAKSVVVSGTRVYVADGLRGLRIFDITDPEDPDSLPSVETPGDASGVAVSEERAYIADDDGGLQIIDLAGPQSPCILTNVPVARVLSEYVDVAISGRYAYVADNDHEMWVIDTQAPAEPAKGVEIGGPGRSIAIQGGRAYVAVGSGGLQVVDISNSADPVVVGAGSAPGFANGLAVAGRRAFIADFDAGLQIIELTRPTSPPIVGSIDTPGRAKKVVVSGSTAYVADGSSGLQIIDVSDPHNPAGLSSVPFGSGADAVDGLLDGEWAYVADRNERVWVVDVADPENPVGASFLTPGLAPFGLALADSLLYVASGTGGMQIYSMRDHRFPTFQGGISATDARDVVVTQGKAYVADWYDGLVVFDVSDPGYPHREDYEDSAAEGARDIVYNDGLLYLTGWFGPRIYTFDSAGMPNLVRYCALPSPAFGSVAEGDDGDVYVAGGASGLQILVNPFTVNLSPAISVLGNIGTPGFALGVAVQGDYAYVAADSAGLVVLPAQCAYVTGVPDQVRVARSMDAIRLVPNPTHSETTISWNQVRGEVVQGAVVDVSGRRVRTLLDAAMPPGLHSIVWDGKDENHSRVASGVYWVHLRGKGGSGVARVVLLR
jgi:hypothetical protein